MLEVAVRGLTMAKLVSPSNSTSCYIVRSAVDESVLTKHDVTGFSPHQYPPNDSARLLPASQSKQYKIKKGSIKMNDQ